MKQRSIILVACCLSICVASCLAFTVQGSDSVTTETDLAIYVGIRLSPQGSNQSTASFFGVPYAQPPLGRLRFAPPLPWSAAAAAEPSADRADINEMEVDVLDTSGEIESTSKPIVMANATRPTCLQAPRSSVHSSITRVASENCLYLNVHSPVGLDSPDSRQLHPVLAWLHDGFLETGAISTPEGPLGWDLVSHQRLVLVEIAYRLGVFGFLKLPGDSGGGNWGLLDQQMALIWIKDSIRAFNGDPGRVTLAGVGAGASCAGLHLYSSGSEPLFHRVAMFGGGPLAPWLFVSETSAVDAVTDDLLRRSGCQRPNASDAVRCLRDADAASIVAHQPPDFRPLDVAAFPVVPDGRFITVSPASGLSISSKPALIGVTNREGESLAARAIGARNASLLTGTQYQEVLDAAFRFYPSFPHRLSPTGRRIVSNRLTAFASAAAARHNRRLLSDGLALWHAVCPSNRFIDALGNSSAPSFVYQLTEPDPDGDSDGASHGQDAAYFMGEPHRDARYGEAQRNLSAHMMAALATFAASGSLSDLGWPSTTESGREFFLLSAIRPSQPGSRPQSGGFSRQDCLFWDQQLAWVNQLGELGGTSTAAPTAAPTPPDESEFWSRCNRTVNHVSLVAISVGAGACLLLSLALTVVLCRRSGRRSTPPPARRSSAGVEAIEMSSHAVRPVATAATDARGRERPGVDKSRKQRPKK